ncbi:MAG: type II toxin-antitoxin system VapC family toxin [Sporichthyaceae bacterium]
MVLDASVLVELVIDGRHRAGADVILNRYAASPALTVVSAAHGLIEAISALRRLEHRGHLDAQDAARAVQWLREFDLTLDPTGPRLSRIWELRANVSACDGAYAAAAEALDAPLVTADEPFRRACKAAGIAAVNLDALREG